LQANRAVTELAKAALLTLLETDYAAFRDRLKRRFGSEDLAEEVLQETWLKIKQLGPLNSVANPNAYVFRMALNIAADFRRGKNRPLTQGEVEALLASAIDVLDPSRIAEARAEMAALERALAALPERTRTIFVMAQVNGEPQDAIAAHMGLSPRTVRKELVRALRHCSKALERKTVTQFRPKG
jgi:RNA polymerase sigma-70 factor (ECF subfamily)